MSKRGTDCALFNTLVLIRRGAHEAHRGTDRDGDGTSAFFWRDISLCNCFGVLVAIQLRSTVSPALPTLSKTQDKSLQGCFEFVLHFVPDFQVRCCRHECAHTSLDVDPGDDTGDAAAPAARQR